MPQIAAGSIHLNYEIRGHGEPLVLIPGFGAGMWIWTRQVEPLAQTFQVITFDPPGVARSEGREGPYTIRLIADDVAELLRAIGIENAHILGASFGGFVAQEFALAYPELTRSLILCCTSFGGAHHVMPSAETLAALASTKGLNTEERMRRNLLLAFSQAFIHQHLAEVEELIKLRAANEVSEHTYLTQLQAAVAFNTELKLSDINVPTLIISGDRDVIVPVQNSVNLAAKIRGAELRIVEGGSHTFFIEQPEQFNRIVTEFISRASQLSVVRSQ